MLVAGSLTACVDDGKDGAQGAVGEQGVAGTPGSDGTSNYVTRTDVLNTNANIAYAAYSDSLIAAISLRNLSIPLLQTLQNLTSPQQKSLG